MKAFISARARNSPALTVARLLPRTGTGYVATFAALILVGGVLPNALALATGLLVSRVQETILGTGGDVLVAPLVLVGSLYILANAQGPFLAAMGSVMGSRFDSALRAEVMRAASSPSGIAHLEDPAVTDRLQNAEELVHGWLTSAAVRGFAQVMSGRIRAVIAAVIIASFRWWLPVPVYLGYVVLRRFRLRTGLMFLRLIDANTQGLRRARYVRTLVTSGQAAKEARIFGVAHWFIERFVHAWRDGMQDLWDERRRNEVSLVPVALLSAAAIGFGAYVLGGSAARGSLDVASAVVMLQCLFAMEGFATQGDADWQMQLGADRIRNARALGDVVHRPDCDLRGTGQAPVLEGGIAFEGVRFAYPGQDRVVLDHVDLDIPMGSSLAIVGDNGAGKTTLTKLLCRLYDPSGGRVTIDGLDLRSIDPASWRRQVGVIFQDFIRYELPARENVGFGAVDHIGDDPALRAAARSAGALETLDRVGWDTTLSRKYAFGTELSGGEWQRVALARALFAVERGARVLVLDEPTANLDVRAEADLYRRFLEITAGVTTIVISHRFSTVRMADRICVIDGGRVVELGTHDELLARGGLYAEMFHAQASAYRDQVEDAGSA